LERDPNRGCPLEIEEILKPSEPVGKIREKKRVVFKQGLVNSQKPSIFSG